jgi:transposase
VYSLRRWEKLSIYTTDGKLQIDNNLVENALRLMAIGRKNYLFAGSHQAAQCAAMIYSLLGTCKINNVNPYEWLRDVFDRIPSPYQKNPRAFASSMEPALSAFLIPSRHTSP